MMMKSMVVSENISILHVVETRSLLAKNWELSAKGEDDCEVFPALCPSFSDFIYYSTAYYALGSVVCQHLSLVCLTCLLSVMEKFVCELTAFGIRKT